MISIIGAGPIGCYTGHLLAKKGLDTTIFEEHKEIGKPIQCTGIVTSKIKDIIKIKDKFVINKIDKTRIFSPNKKYVEIKFKNENLILDRMKFDQHLADKAIKSGARIFLNTKFLDYQEGLMKLKYKKNNNITSLKTNVLIGADGPSSNVSKLINKKQKFWTGIQVRARYKNENIVEFYPNIGTIAWVVPESDEIARIGLMAKNSTANHFEKFLKLKSINKENILEKQGGLIPIYNSRIKTQKNNVYIVGDSATQVKATTGGGIIQGLFAAKCLSKSIVNNEKYDWKNMIGKDLWLHLKIRKMLDRFSDKDYDYLVNLCNKEKNKEIFEKYDRDNIVLLMTKLILKEPRLLYFIKHLIP